MEYFQHLKIELRAIESATNNFSADSCIGLGGFGSVYKGELVHSKGESMVALKRLDPTSIQGGPEFWKEVMMLPLYTHKNIISLLGYCDDNGEKILVYEYAPKRSLDSYLASDDLTWIQRLKICVGAARGLAHLHTPSETQLRIVHRDIKSSNILLDNDWNAKISDFGLSKFAPANNQFTYMISNPAGTLGYIDPLYHEDGILTKESDVYSFGVVLFEVLCGRLCYGNSNLPPLVGLAREYYLQNKISELVYSKIKDQIDITSLKMYVDIAYRCLSIERKKRPLMTEIVSTLENALVTQEKVDGKRSGILHVKVLKEMDDKSKYDLDVPNNYMMLQLFPFGHDHPQTVKVEWNEMYTLYVEDIYVQHVVIVVNHVQSEDVHFNVGEARIQPSFDVTNHDINMTRSFQVPLNFLRQYVRYLNVEMLCKPLVSGHTPTISTTVKKAPIGTPKDGGLLVIIIHGAIHDQSIRDTSITLCFRGESRKTPFMGGTNKPIWLQEFTFMLEQPPTDEYLELKLHYEESTGLLWREGSFGWADISLADVVIKKWTCQSYKLELDNSYVPDNSYVQVEMEWRTYD